jgi:hypothetical protein
VIGLGEKNASSASQVSSGADDHGGALAFCLSQHHHSTIMLYKLGGGEKCLPALPPPCTMSVATPEVYVTELERLKFGRPLYSPELPINIGDVGFFERDTGNFFPLFNVFVEARAQLYARFGTPNGFEPLSRDRLRILTMEDYFPPQPIKSGSVESKAVELEASAYVRLSGRIRIYRLTIS